MLIDDVEGAAKRNPCLLSSLQEDQDKLFGKNPASKSWLSRGPAGRRTPPLVSGRSIGDRWQGLDRVAAIPADFLMTEKSDAIRAYGYGCVARAMS